MPASVLRRNEEQLDHEENTTQTVDLDRDELYAGLDVRIAGDVVATGAEAHVVDGPLDYVREIAVKVAGQDILRLPGRSWYRLTQIFTGRAPAKTDAGTGIATHPFSVIVPVPFRMLRVLLENISMFPAWRYRQAVLEITYGVLADLTASAGTLESLTATVQKRVAEEIEPDFMARVHELAMGRAEQAEKEVTGDSDNFRLDLATQRMVRALLISTTDDDVYEDDIVEELTLKKGSGETVFGPISWTELREHNESLYQIALPAGWAVLDFAEDQDISRLLDATRIDKLTLQSKVAVGGGTTKVYVDQIGLQASGLAAA